MSATGYMPVPTTPAERGWDTLEGYLLEVRLDVEWSVAPDYETLGRLTVLRSNLDCDIGYLSDLREKLDGMIASLAGARYEADFQEAGGRDAEA